MRKNKLNIVIVIICGLMISGSVMSILRGYLDPTFNSDALHYLMPIHNLLAGKGYTYGKHFEVMYPPGYGILSYVAFLFVRDIEYSGLVVSAVSYILLIPLAYTTTRFLFGREAGLLAAWSFTFFPALVDLSSNVGSDALACLCVVLSFHTYLRLLQGGREVGRAVLLGCLLGFSYLVRPESLLLGILAILSLVVFCIRDTLTSNAKDQVPVLHRLVTPILVAVGLFALASPYVFFLKEHTGRWTFSTKAGINLRVGEASIEGPHHKIESLDKMSASGESVGFLQYVRSQGLKYSFRVIRNWLIEVYSLVRMNFHAIVPLMLLWLLYPFVSARKLFTDRELPLPWPRVATAFLAFSSALAIYPLFFIEPRFLTPYSLLILILLSFLMITFLKTILTSLGKNWMKPGIAALCFVSVSSSVAAGFIGRIPRMPQELMPDSLYGCLTNLGNSGYRPAGEWLGKHTEAGKNVTVLNPGRPDVILFYASGKTGLPGQGVPVGLESTLPELTSLLQSHTQAYLVVTKEQIQLLNYQCPCGCPLAALWENPEQGTPLGLALLYQDRRARFKIYKLLGPT